MNKASSRADNERVTSKNLVVVNAIALSLAVVSLLAIVIFSIAFADSWRCAGATAGLALVQLGATALGGAVGGLFGVPKQKGDGTAGVVFVPGTQLEDVAEWLSKIVLGATLAELREIPRLVESVAVKVATMITADPAAVPFASAVLVVGAITGFFWAYFMARLGLPGAFLAAQLTAVPEEAVQATNEAPFEPREGSNAVFATGAGDRSAATLATLGIDELKTADQLRAWARVQFNNGNRDAADEALTRALKLQPQDQGVIEDLAVVRVKDGRDMPDLLTRSPTPDYRSVSANRLEQRLFSMLYTAGGYQRAITEGRAWLGAGGQPSALIHFYLGCAYGQAFQASQQESDRAAALEHLQAAAQDAGARRRLAVLLDPSRAGADTDLQSFWDDPAFRALVT